jgi:putative transposase
MARVPRYLTVRKGFSVHKIWRGHNREFNLGTDSDKAAYLAFMNEDLESKDSKPGSWLEALTLMGNHTHEKDHVTDQKRFSDHMRRHHSRYGAYFNRKYKRCGKVAQDRPKTCLIGSVWHEMMVTFYIHANPLRARLVRDLKNYRWSTHRLYAFGLYEDWMRNIVLPQWYMNLGKTMKQRQKKYRSLFQKYLKESNPFLSYLIRRPFFGPPHWTRQNEQRISNWEHERPPP